MSILIDKDTKVITQGITGKTGQFHTRGCRDYANGKNCFVAGVNPKKAGEDFEGIPIYAGVKEAKAATGATVSVIYVPPAGAAAAIWEAVEADLDLAICITEGIPVRDMLEVRNRMKAKVAAILVNIFGGIMRCDTIAEGVIAACRATNLTVPLVVRMKGTNEELGKKLLAESGLPIISADSMAEAAQAVIAALR
jgi:succinyl-CoA synthetase alpha subunit